MAEETAGAIIGRNVRNLRDAGLWTRSELAEKSGVSRQAIAHLELGTSDRPRRGTIEKLARGLGVEVETLLRGVEGSNVPLGIAPPLTPWDRVWARINLLESTAAQWERLFKDEHYNLEGLNLETLNVIDDVGRNVVINHAYDAASMKQAVSDKQRALLEQAEQRMFDANLSFWGAVEKHLSDTQPHSVTDELQAARERRNQWEQFSASDTAGSRAV